MLDVKPRLHQGNMLPGNMLLVAGNMYHGNMYPFVSSNRRATILLLVAGNMLLAGNMLPATSNMLPWCKRGFTAHTPSLVHDTDQ